MQGGDHDDRYDDSNYPRRRFAAQVGPNSILQRSKLKSVLMERPVHIDDLKYLIFEDRSPYTVFMERRWMRILEPKGKVVYPNIVREFYEELGNSSGTTKFMSISVRGVTVKITPDTIASYLDLPRPHDYRKYSDWSDHEIYHALTDAKDLYDHHTHKVISQKELLPFFQMLHLIVSTNVSPTEDTTKVSIKQRKFLIDIARGVDIDLPNHIFKIIDGSAYNKKLPFGLLITGLFLEAGVKIESDEEGQQPMEPIRSTKPISQTRSLPYPSTQQATIASSSKDHQTRPPWFDALLIEIDLRVAAQIAPIQSRLKDMEDRLQELYGVLDKRR